MALNAENNSLEIILQGSTLVVQKISNGEKNFITIPHKNIANTASIKSLIQQIVKYVSGSKVQSVAVAISDEAEKYILSCVA